MTARIVRRLALFCFCAAFSLSAADAPAASPFLKVLDKDLSPGAARGFALLDGGSLKESESEFNKAVEKRADDFLALSGLATLASMRNEWQRSLEYQCKAIAAAGASPFAELGIEGASSHLRYCKDPAPFLKLLDEQNAAKLSADNRDVLRECAIEHFIEAGKYADAAKLSRELGFVTRFMLIGPFDNRDKAGFAAVQDPEKEIDFEKSCEGRNRRVAWHPFDAELLDGRVWLADVFEPNIHALAYAAVLFKSDARGEAILRAGCGGALKMWFNGKPVATLSEYNDFGSNKLSAVVAIREGWNLVLLKTAVEEETQWGFSLRVCDPKGGALKGLTFETNKTNLEAWRKDQSDSNANGQVAQAEDGRLLSVLRRHLAANPNDALALNNQAVMMELHRLGEAKNSSSDAPSPEKFMRAAIALAPKSPLYRVNLAAIADDNNEARTAAEQAAKSHPDLPCVHEMLALIADRSRMQIQAEDYARKSWKLHGAERCGESALVLARLLAERGERAEAWLLLKQFTEEHPYHAAAWQQRIDWEDSTALRAAALDKALQFCGGDKSLLYKRIDDLDRLGKNLDAARLASESLKTCPLSVAAVRYASNEYRRAGYPENAKRIVESALRNAPEQPELLALSAQLKLRAGHPDEAAALFKQALAIKPNAPEYKDYLALLGAGTTLDREFFAAYDIAFKDIPSPDAAKFPKDNIVKLLNQEVVRVNPNGTTSRMIHLVAKVLRPTGVNELRQHYIYYEPNRQTVDILRASAMAPDGREISRAQVNDRSTSAAAGVDTLIYDEHHLKQVSFSDLVPGTTIDLQYTIRDNGDNIYGDYFADSFYFNDGHPSVRAQYVLDYPKTLAVQTKTHRTETPAQRLESKDPGREIVKWELNDLPGAQREYAMPPLVESLPQLQVTTMKSWQEVGAWFWNLAKDQVTVNAEMRTEIAEITRDAKTDTEKLRAVHDWVIRKIRYLGIEFGRNGYKPHKAIESYKSLYGDCKDTATLLTAMLKSIGIESKLVLIRTVNAGAVSPDSLPMPNLYNHCIAYVPNVDGKSYWIDGTTDFFKLGEVPSADRGANVLVAGPEGGSFMKIPQSAAFENRIEQVYDVSVSRTGSATVLLKDSRAGQFAPPLRESIDTPGRFERGIKDLAARRFNGAELKKLKASDPLSEGPAWSEIELSVSQLGSSTGDRLELPATFEPLNLTQRYASDTQRINDLQFYTPWSRKMTIHYKFDPASKIASLPKEEKIDMPLGRYTRTVKQDGAELTIDELFELPSTRIPAKEYESFKNMCQRVDELLEQKVLLQN